MILYLFPPPQYMDFQWQIRHYAAKESLKIIPRYTTMYLEEIKDSFLAYIGGGEL
jgi:hypothetical protein